MVGNNYIYRSGYYKTKQIYTDDGHVGALPDTLWKIKDLNGNHFKVLLYLESHKISFLDTLASVAALGSIVFSLMSSVYAYLYSENYDKFKIIENILTKKMKIKIEGYDKPKKKKQRKKK